MKVKEERENREMVWGGRWEGGSGLGTHVHPRRIHVDVWQNQYSIVNLDKVKKKRKKKRKVIQHLFKTKNINSSALNFLHSPTITSIHDRWKNHSFD